jgi:predicted nucleic acid-binding protein
LVALILGCLFSKCEIQVYLAAALGTGAEYSVTYDKDLLTLKKPFGIETIRPAEFLRRIKD